jgi:hypothetical protein
MNIDLEDVLTNSHSLSGVRGAECDYSDEVTCQCGWDGSPNQFGNHLLVALGLREIVLNNWQRDLIQGPWVMLPGGGASRAPVAGLIEVHPFAQEEFLNTLRGPKDQRKLTKDERKALAAWYRERQA